MKAGLEKESTADTYEPHENYFTMQWYTLVRRHTSKGKATKNQYLFTPCLTWVSQTHLRLPTVDLQPLFL